MNETASLHNPYELPSELKTKYQEVERQFNVWLDKEEFEETRDIRKLWEELYRNFLVTQNTLRYRLHKGGVLHNLGIISLIENDLKSTFKNFVLGFSEDVASQEQRFLDNAEAAPGAKNLQTFFLVNQKFFDLVRAKVKTLLLRGKFQDSRSELEPFLLSQLKKESIKERIKLLEKYPFVIRKDKSINRIPGAWRKRVFIGGSYSAERIKNLFEIKKVVKDRGYIPIIANEFADTEPPIHDHSLLLLHNCKFAIFDVSKDSGYLMEVERTFDYQTETVLVYEERLEPSITRMITSLKREIKKFATIDELKIIINDFFNKYS